MSLGLRVSRFLGRVSGPIIEPPRHLSDYHVRVDPQPDFADPVVACEKRVWGETAEPNSAEKE